MMTNKLWLVDDDRSVRIVLSQALRDAGYEVMSFDSADTALAAFETEALPQLVITDVRMPGTDGFSFLEALKKNHENIPVIVMSAYTDIASTASAFRGGAHEFLSKPFDIDEAVSLVARALPENTIEPGKLQKEEGHELLGSTPAMRELFRAIGRLAQVALSVLITGETGTGKELVARALHGESPRAHKPFIALNTAAIPAELLESELFGHEAGAFTGAHKKQIGRFEQADGGTLFLDEIGDMPSALQTRLLRVLAEGEFFRVGGRELIRVDVRVIAATHQHLEALVKAGKFRADLLHRLDVVRLQLPPLRERKEDVPALAERFLQQAAKQLKASAKRFKPEALQHMQQYHWPGNVRELENLCWRLAAMAPGENIGLKDLKNGMRNEESSHQESGDWQQALALTAHIHAQLREQFDKVLLETALEFTDGHRQQAAEKLGLGRNTLTRKLGTSRGGKNNESV
jgi:two-component system, NtrC family, nitrogen regulation response regulator GlnG